MVVVDDSGRGWMVGRRGERVADDPRGSGGGHHNEREGGDDARWTMIDVDAIAHDHSDLCDRVVIHRLEHRPPSLEEKSFVMGCRGGGWRLVGAGGW